MTKSESKVITQLTELVDAVLEGDYKRVSINKEIEEVNDPELNDLTQKVLLLQKQYLESYEFILDLSQGKLNVSSPHDNSFTNPFKQLHSDLRHLTWQIKQIADGDYDQRVSFSGDFSYAFNKMILALRERQILAELNEENKQLFQSFFNTSPDGVIICDLNRKIELISITAKKMLQLTDEDVQEGLYLDDLIEDEYRKNIQTNFEKLTTGIPMVFEEIKVKKKDGTSTWNEPNASMLKDSKGNPKGFIIIFRDITRRKDNEQQLLKFADDLQESNSAKDVLFSIIAHDLKDPFNTLLGFSKLLLESVKSGKYEDVEFYFGLMNNSAERAYSLLINLLDWSMLQLGGISVNLEATDISELIRNNIMITNASAQDKKLEIIYDNDESYWVVTDKTILNTILRNLIYNAVKYTPEKGRIVLTVNSTPDFYYISVQDNGVGIKEENLTKLFKFNEFQTTLGTNNEKGTGLGLLLCKHFIDLLGGSITVKSIYQKGSTFTISLPNIPD
ncbi:MAG: PAS domain S-box protein [Bacteroidales bacterium]|nr:PAS domain S-box protein [Bacteroidales bacterium]